MIKIVISQDTSRKLASYLEKCLNSEPFNCELHTMVSTNMEIKQTCQIVIVDPIKEKEYLCGMLEKWSANNERNKIYNKTWLCSCGHRNMYNQDHCANCNVINRFLLT